ncbi:MAG: glycosyltransferase family 4 protein [Bacteroidota bacterium]
MFNILQICQKVPYPPRDGGTIAMNNLTKGLIDLGNEVKVLAINTSKDFVNVTKLPAGYLSKTRIEAVSIDTSLELRDAFTNLFSSRSYNIQRFISGDFESKLIEILKNDNYDLIQLESLFVTPYIKSIRKYSGAKVVLRAHNVEFEIWKRMAATCKNPAKKTYLKLLTKRLRKYEQEQLNSYDAIAAITLRDVNFFMEMGCKVPIIDIPVGTDILDAGTQHPAPGTKRPAPSLFHLGSMDWMPNTEAIKWFLDKVWMKIHRQYPELKFYIAGKKIPGWLKKVKNNNVEIVGEVEDAMRFMNTKSIMIVPLLSGGGMRVKIIEGMALGKIVISTSIGAEGIQCEHLKNILIADTPGEFLDMIGKCMENRSFCDEIGSNARLLIKEHYDNTEIAKKLVDFYKTLVTVRV